MEKSFDWQVFWSEWRNKPAQSEYDLYFQVAKTVNSKAMDRPLFDAINESIVQILQLRPADTLVELCCGNGLCTYELAKRVERVLAVDFAAHLIADAKKFKSAANIVYTQSDVTVFLDSFLPDLSYGPLKCLMNDSLAYFTPAQLRDIVWKLNRCTRGAFVFLIRGIPNDELKWNYYNTEERRERYRQLVSEADSTNDGMGRWWKPREIIDICNELNLQCQVTNQPSQITNYRMDVIISGITNTNVNANN